MTISRRSLRAVAVAVMLAACGLGRPEVARVGDAQIDAAELRHAVAVQRALADLQGSACGQSVRGESQTSACTRTALSGELLWLAVVDFARDRGISASMGEVDRAIEQLEAQVGAEQLDATLAERGLSRSDLAELGRRILTIRAVRTQVAEERVGEAELRSLYEDRILEFTIVNADHILVKTEAEARNVYALVKDASEARFVALAKRVSIEPGAEQRGGRLGSAVASGYAAEFARAAAGLEPGLVSRPVHTQFGWHVIYLVDKEVTSFDAAKGQLAEPVADEEFRGWLEDRAGDLGVEVDPRYGRFVPETFTVTPVRSTDPERDDRTPSP